MNSWAAGFPLGRNEAVGEAGIALVGEPGRVPGEQGASGVADRELRERDHAGSSGGSSIDRSGMYCWPACRSASVSAPWTTGRGKLILIASSWSRRNT